MITFWRKTPKVFLRVKNSEKNRKFSTKMISYPSKNYKIKAKLTSYSFYPTRNRKIKDRKFNNDNVKRKWRDFVAIVSRSKRKWLVTGAKITKSTSKLRATLTKIARSNQEWQATDTKFRKVSWTKITSSCCKYCKLQAKKVGYLSLGQRKVTNYGYKNYMSIAKMTSYWLKQAPWEKIASSNIKLQTDGAKIAGTRHATGAKITRS